MSETFDQIISRLIDEKVQLVEKNLLAKLEESKDRTVDIIGAMEITKLKKGTIYNLKSMGKIPCFKPGKRILFSVPELSKWVRSGRVAIA